MPLFSPEDLAAVRAPFERARPLPARAYTEDAVLAYERREIFDRSWICVGREDELTHPGAWLRAPLTDEGILVTRGADLASRRFPEKAPRGLIRRRPGQARSRRDRR